jgi:Fe-S cluster assembly scaffold protein SufB
MGFIVGENIHRISAERNKKDRMPVRMEIKVSPTLKSVVKKDANIGGEVKPGVTFEFEFKVDYEEFGEIIVEGGVFFTDTPDKLKKLEKGWIDESQIVDEDVRLGIMNRIMEIGYLEAIAIAKQVKLPAPLQLPRFTKDKEKIKKPVQAG